MIMRPATPTEVAEHLAGHRNHNAVETEHGLTLPDETAAALLDDFLLWLQREGWIKPDLLDQARDITVADFIDHRVHG